MSAMLLPAPATPVACARAAAAAQLPRSATHLCRVGSLPRLLRRCLLLLNARRQRRLQRLEHAAQLLLRALLVRSPAERRRRLAARRRCLLPLGPVLPVREPQLRLDRHARGRGEGCQRRPRHLVQLCQQGVEHWLHIVPGGGQPIAARLARCSRRPAAAAGWPCDMRWHAAGCACRPAVC